MFLFCRMSLMTKETFIFRNCCNEERTSLFRAWPNDTNMTKINSKLRIRTVMCICIWIQFQERRLYINQLKLFCLFIETKYETSNGNLLLDIWYVGSADRNTNS